MAGARGVLSGVLVLTTLEIVTRTTGSATRTGQLLQLPVSILEWFVNPNTPLLGAGGVSSSANPASTSSSSHPLAGQPAGSPYSTPTTKPVGGTPATRDLNP
jgi:hypothetical protein